MASSEKSQAGATPIRTSCLPGRTEALIVSQNLCVADMVDFKHYGVMWFTIHDLGIQRTKLLATLHGCDLISFVHAPARANFF